jgi:TonB family protein
MTLPIYTISIILSLFFHLFIFKTLKIFPEHKPDGRGYSFYGERVITASLFRVLPPSGSGGKKGFSGEVLKGIKGINKIPAKSEEGTISFEEAISELLGEGSEEGIPYSFSYFEEIKRKIMKEWNLPEGMKEQLKSLKCTILMKMRRDGEVLELKILRSSGNELYDLSAIRAIKKAAPFSPFPMVIPKEEIEIEVEF